MTGKGSPASRCLDAVSRALDGDRGVRIARRAGDRQTEAFQALLIRLTDLLKGIKPLKAMALENRMGLVILGPDPRAAGTSVMQ